MSEMCIMSETMTEHRGNDTEGELGANKQCVLCTGSILRHKSEKDDDMMTTTSMN